MRINTNISAMNTYSRLTSANSSKAGSLAKLSSGLRINKAGDDAAGLSISEKMRGQVSGLKQSVRNAQDGISLIQTAEGALSETHSILQRMRELSVQSANDTNTSADRMEIQKEVDELSAEMTRIGKDTQFNTQNLLNGDYKDKTFHIGANKDQKTDITIGDMQADALKVEGTKKDIGSFQDLKLSTRNGDIDSLELKITDDSDTLGKGFTAGSAATIELTKGSSKADLITILEDNGFQVEHALNANDLNDSATEEVQTDLVSDTTGEFGIDVSTQATANDAINTIDNAISTVSAERSKLGATQNRLEHTINNLNATSENLSEAESRIRDVDMAEEMMEFTKSNILSQAATAMLAQANQMPQGVLQLLQ